MCNLSESKTQPCTLLTWALHTCCACEGIILIKRLILYRLTAVLPYWRVGEVLRAARPHSCEKSQNPGTSSFPDSPLHRCADPKLTDSEAVRSRGDARRVFGVTLGETRGVPLRAPAAIAGRPSAAADGGHPWRSRSGERLRHEERSDAVLQRSETVLHGDLSRFSRAVRSRSRGAPKLRPWRACHGVGLRCGEAPCGG